jgi:hypothetical protein
MLPYLKYDCIGCLPPPRGEGMGRGGLVFVVVVLVVPALWCSVVLILTDHTFQRLAEQQLYEVVYYVTSNRLIGV